MNTTRLIKGVVAGFVALALIGWLVYDVVLGSYMKDACNQCMDRGSDEQIMWAMLLANLGHALFFTLIFAWAGVMTIADGLKKGTVIAFVLAFSMAMFYYGYSTMYNDATAMIVDIIAGTVVGGLASIVIAWAMNMGKKPA